jgi:hypothetical protein
MDEMGGKQCVSGGGTECVTRHWRGYLMGSVIVGGVGEGQRGIGVGRRRKLLK